MRVNQVPNRNFIQGRRGPVALANAYRKFGLAVPKELLDVIDAIVAQILANLRQGRIGGGGRMSPGMVGGGRMPINQTAVGNTPVPAAGATQGM